MLKTISLVRDINSRKECLLEKITNEMVLKDMVYLFTFKIK